MNLKLTSGLAASILIGSGLAPFALTADPAGASTQVCIDDESYSLTTKNFPSNYNSEAGMAYVRSDSAPWDENGPLADELSKSYFQNEAAFIYGLVGTDGIAFLYAGRNNGVDKSFSVYESSGRLISQGLAPTDFYVAASPGDISCNPILGGGDFDDLLADLDPTLRQQLTARLRAADPVTRRRRLGQFISAVALPKNVTAAGGLATQAYVNDLADTILERLPMRQFTPISIEEEITEVEVEETITEPVRGLWKTSGTAELDAEIATLTINDTVYAENPNLTSIYTEPNGTRVWARGFGGSKQPYKTGGEYGKRGVVFYPDVYNDFYSSHGGIVVGVDTSLSENIQLGIFGNYGDINLTQFAGASTGGGSWNPSGFGGGVMASYWEDNFYVQGLFGATSFSGDNKRQVKVGNILNETYTATKDTTSYVGALRVGAPLTWGSLILEPQATAIWNGNEDASYKESGRYRAFALKVDSYSDNFLETTVGAKLAWPIKQGSRNLLVPNLKVAWLADWDTGNDSVKFKRAYSRRARSRTAEIPSNQETQNGVLVEGGIDYAIFQGPTSGWKLYAKGGAKIWADANTDWRTSGGVTFQF